MTDSCADTVPLTPARFRQWMIAKQTLAEPTARQGEKVRLWIDVRRQKNTSAVFDEGFARDLHKFKWMVAAVPYPALSPPRAAWRG